MLKLFIFLIISSLQGCANLDASEQTSAHSSSISRDQACEQQAQVWCGTAGQPNAANAPCVIHYLDDHCLAHQSPIDESAQDECINDILTSTTPSTIPESCVATW